MTQNRRIFLNIVATYGRSVFALVCGLVTARWVLMALGAEAYGLYGIVGVVIVLCTTLNFTISASISRFYAYALGREAVVGKQASIEECRAWFNVAIFVNAMVPLILALFGFFIGNWAIDNYFSIPAKYVCDSHFMLQCSLITMYVGMVSAPFRSMYTAKQYIAEMTVYDVFSPLILLCCAYALVRYQGNRLRLFALYSMFVAVVPAIIIDVRSFFVFEECRIDFRKMIDVKKFREFFSFAGWQFVGLTGLTIRNQGAPIVVNKCVGLVYNSTMSIANGIASHIGSLSAALNGAFAPVIIAAAGSGDREKFYRVSLQASKFGTLLVCLFVIPFCVESHFVIHLWLGTPPPEIVPLSIVLLLNSIVERCGYGALIAINADGNVKWHEMYCFIIHVITVGLCYGLSKCGLGILGVGVGLTLGTALLTIMRMLLWKFQLTFPLLQWVEKFLVPLSIAIVLSMGLGVAPVFFVQEGIGRLFLTSFISIGAFALTSFCLVLDKQERFYVINQVQAKLHHFV